MSFYATYISEFRGRPLEPPEPGASGFRRRFEVGEASDASAIEAELQAGVLTVHPPTAEWSRRERAEGCAAGHACQLGCPADGQHNLVSP